MRRNLRLLRPFGRMIELGKRDFYENSRLGLRPFRNNITYFGIDADQLIAHRPDTARRVFQELMKLFAEGALRPLPHRSFCATDVEVAFRQMQASRHTGKIVVTFPEDFAPGESQAEEVSSRRWHCFRTPATPDGWPRRFRSEYCALVGESGRQESGLDESHRSCLKASPGCARVVCRCGRDRHGALLMMFDAESLRAALSALDGANMPPLREALFTRRW